MGIKRHISNMKPGILENHPYREVFEENDVFVKTPDKKDDYRGRLWGGEGRLRGLYRRKGKKYLEGTVKGNSSEKRFKRDGVEPTTVNTTALRGI